ncbi:MAG: hypothetical protein IJN65_01955, partial [Clostridia bacterium]|nr:hypothetical protein [Clostridia bacterium]
MFAVVKTVYTRPKGIRKILSKRPVCLLKKMKISNSYYYELTVNHRSKKINWDKVFKTVNVCDVPVIMPKNQNIDPTQNVRPFYAKIFWGIIYANCAGRIYPSNSKAFVIDNDFDNSDALYILLKNFKEVSVFTTNEQKYEHLKTKAENELGISPVFCDSLTAAQNADFLINLQHSECTCVNKNILGQGGYTFSHSDIRLPKNIERLVPRNISPFVFAAAVYELSKIQSLGDCTVTKLKNNATGKIIEIK